MIKIVKTVLPFTILVGVFCFIYGLIDSTGTILHQQTIQYGSYTWTFYRFDTHQYLINLQTSGNITQLKQIVPSIPILPTTPTGDILEVFNFLINIMLIYVTNWVIYIVNLAVIMPLKIILYPVNIILAILGINTAADNFIYTINWLYQANIPNVPYI